MKKILVTIFISITLLPHLATGQCSSSQKKPTWVDGFFQEERYSYIESATATGNTESEARNKAAQIIMERRSLGTGQRVKVEIINGTSVISGINELEVKARIIDEYREYCGVGQYRISLLVQTAKNPTYEYERVQITNTYPFSARVFVPGLAQLHKGSKGKGIFFITSEIVLIGGIVTCEVLRASYKSKISSAPNSVDRIKHMNTASNLEIARNIFIGGAAAIYVWNIIDGIVAKGERHVIVTPYASYNSKGVTLNVRF